MLKHSESQFSPVNDGDKQIARYPVDEQGIVTINLPLNRKSENLKWAMFRVSVHLKRIVFSRRTSLFYWF